MQYPIWELFSYFIKYNLFNKHNFELTTKQIGSHATPLHLFSKDFTKT